MIGRGVNYGDPFLLQVSEGNLNGRMGNEDYGLFETTDQEENFFLHACDECQDYGMASTIYVCIPIGRVWTDDPGDPNDSTKAPNRVVHIDRAKTELERMARAAIAMGVSNEAKGHSNA